VRRKLCILTGTRAEYGLLRWLMKEIADDPSLQLQIIATGMHMSPEFGLTYREIEKDGFEIDEKIEILTSSDTPTGVAKSMGLGLICLAEAIQRLRPDFMVVLGDRFEILAAAAAATVTRIPLAHLHGGERTEGAIDEAFRHSITKMAHLHFVATEEYRRRVIQLGEDPRRVFRVGGLGVDGIQRTPLLSRRKLEAEIEFKFGRRNLLVTYHPVTLEPQSSAEQLRQLLSALDAFPDVHIIFTMPNADAEGRVVVDMIRRFVDGRPNARAYMSLGQLLYLSCLRQVDGVIGNSSSGLTEMPTFRNGTINIGDRQRGRLRAASVIDCEPSQQAIQASLHELWSGRFQASLKRTRNPYGDGGASRRVVKVLRSYPLDSILKKFFYDLPVLHGHRGKPRSR